MGVALQLLQCDAVHIVIRRTRDIDADNVSAELRNLFERVGSGADIGGAEFRSRLARYESCSAPRHAPHLHLVLAGIQDPVTRYTRRSRISHGNHGQGRDDRKQNNSGDPSRSKRERHGTTVRFVHAVSSLKVSCGSALFDPTPRPRGRGRPRGSAWR